MTVLIAISNKLGWAHCCVEQHDRQEIKPQMKSIQLSVSTALREKSQLGGRAKLFEIRSGVRTKRGLQVKADTRIMENEKLVESAIAKMERLAIEGAEAAAGAGARHELTGNSWQSRPRQSNFPRVLVTSSISCGRGRSVSVPSRRSAIARWPPR